MRDVDMHTFWNERADEDAFYFVDSRLEYGSPDLERFWAAGEEELQVVLGALEVELPERAGTILEIGCGVGRITRALAPHADRVIAVDVSSRMLEFAQEHNRELTNVDWMLGDGTTLSGVESGSVDIAHSAVVFQHIPDPAITLGYITEVGRVLAPGGWAALMVSNVPGTGWHRRRGLRVRIPQLARVALGKAPKGQAHPAWLGSAVELEAVEQAASAGGMEVARVSGEGSPYCYLYLRKPA